MLTLSLEPIDPLAHPAFRDVAGCAQWLSQLQLTNLQLAHSLLYTQITQLNRCALPGLERLNILEQLRETVGFVQDDYAKKLIAKPLPLDENELMIFVALVQLWHALVIGYQRCLQAYLDGEPELRPHGALLCHRCLLYTGLEIFEHLRTGYDFDAILWRQLHELYAFAEDQNIHLEEVNDPLDTVRPQSSCRASYAKTMLACYARPSELSRSQLRLLDRWLTLWSHMVTVERSYTLSDGDPKPLAVDLNSSRGLQPIALPPTMPQLGAATAPQTTPAGPPQSAAPDNVSPEVSHRDSMRYLATAPIGKLLRVNIVMLQQGQTPQPLDLDSHFDRNDCIEFFTFLHECWCGERNVRFGERHEVHLRAQLCYKLEGIYAHLSGKPFKQPERDTTSDHLAYRQIATFGRILQDAHDKKLLEMGFPLETWNLENVSIMGARLSREDPLGIRLSTNQLIAVRPSDSAAFTLGVTAWVNVTPAGKLRIGVRFFPGSAEPVSIRTMGVNPAVANKYAPAFLLGAVPALKAPASLVIPRDWFQQGRAIEVLHQNKNTYSVKLGFSVERGSDYERVSFTLV